MSHNYLDYLDEDGQFWEEFDEFLLEREAEKRRELEYRQTGYWNSSDDYLDDAKAFWVEER